MRPGRFHELDDNEVLDRAFKAEQALTAATKQGIERPGDVMKSLNPAFASQFGLFMQGSTAQSPQSIAIQQLAEQVGDAIGKNITLTSPLTSGFVPFDLLAPSRLIWPMYTVFRNKLPRVPGQGTSHRAKVGTGIQGTNTGSGNGPKPITLSELNGGNFGQWPIAMPPAGNLTAVDLNIPYAFMGLSESLSWLAQFGGQGFEDISSLINLILLQEMMLGEEYQMMWGTAHALNAPAGPTITTRTAGANETAVPAAGTGNDYYVVVTATNIYGETLMSAVVATGIANQTGHVADVVIAPVPGATQYNIYTSAATATGSPPSARAAFFLNSAGVGGIKFTLQGTLASSGTNPPSANTTNNTTSFEGLISILDGWAATNSVYPAGWQGGYVNQNVGDTLNANVLNTAMQAFWDTGGYKADPTEIVCSGPDARLLGESIGAQSGNTGYRLFIQQAEDANIRAGAAVSEYVNPVTRSTVRLIVHPWLTQGTAFLMSYNLPMSWSNVANAFEMVMVQDYVSISWPVIDPTFRYSIFAYGAPVAYAPQYSGILQGLQRSNTAPFS